MPRFTNSQTGVVVNVDDATAEQLGPDWSPADGGESKTATRKASTRKSD